MLRLYGSAKSRAIRVLWMIHELGIAFENPIFEGATDREILEYFSITANRFRVRALRRYLVEQMGLSIAWPNGEESYEELLKRTGFFVQESQRSILDELNRPKRS